jgi:hypothetical protein
MRRRSYIILTLAVFALTLTSCQNYKKLRFIDTQVTNVKFIGTSQVELDLNVQIDNPTVSSYTITNLFGTFYKNDKDFADVQILDDVTIVPRSMNNLPVPLQLTMINPLGFLNGISLDTFKTDAYTVSLDITVRNGIGLSKHIIYDHVPAKDLLDEFRVSGIAVNK